ncbi:baeRF11 domain-containing protein [Agrococcus casei]|uniref:baeRF11 domain-containing protein n=1 Tax=Agrococcus casei TaxID=343512 RepID=UPI003F8DDE87
MSIDIPTPGDFAQLTQSRDDASVSIYVSASGAESHAITHNIDAAQTSLRSALGDSLRELAEGGAPAAVRSAISKHIDGLLNDRLFWATGARSLAIFVTPDELRVFRLMNRLPFAHSTGDRFDVGPMVRAVTFDHAGYALAVAEGDVRLLRLTSDATSHRVELENLPEDAADALTREPATGRFNRHRADGTLGPKVEQRRYASIVQEAVLAAIGEDRAPLVLAAASDLDPAYREVNSYEGLLAKGIGRNPASLDDAALTDSARAVIDEHHKQSLVAWRETFGTRQANGRASSQLSDIAQAAWAGQIEQLLFDLDCADEGTIDEYGRITHAAEESPKTYRIVDEIAAQVLRTGGVVRAVRAGDLPDESPAAATFRNHG